MLMEFVEGVTLEQKLKGKVRCRVAAAVDYMRAGARGARIRSRQGRCSSRHQAREHDADAARASSS